MHRPPLPLIKYSWYSSLLEADQPQGHSVSGRIMSMQTSNDTIGNRTRNPPTSSAVPQPTALPHNLDHLVYPVQSLECMHLPSLPQIHLVGTVSKVHPRTG
jgi:hypothetical protein